LQAGALRAASQRLSQLWREGDGRAVQLHCAS
jgi:hypothetical protein